jgi:hypothetical protein
MSLFPHCEVITQEDQAERTRYQILIVGWGGDRLKSEGSMIRDDETSHKITQDSPMSPQTTHPKGSMLWKH